MTKVCPDGLLPLDNDFPVLACSSSSNVQIYNATTKKLTVSTAPPLSFQDSFFGFPSSVTNGSMAFEIQLDEDGCLIPSTTGDDITIIGDMDHDFDATLDASGTLLTGRIVDWGYADAGSSAASFDFKMEVTGGALAVESFTGSDGVTEILGFGVPGTEILVRSSSSNTNFNSDFTVNFNAELNLSFGPIYVG